MQITFSKYQGAGNDFVVIDDRNHAFNASNYQLIHFLCDRRFGIGADGLMLLRNHSEYDFEMLYFNADGHEGSMCGNGGRCIVAFAHHLGIIKNSCKFIAVDGEHLAEIQQVDGNNWVSLKMINVDEIENNHEFTFMNTGSPHYVKLVNDLAEFPVFNEGQSVRYNNRFKEKGTNVNFIEINDLTTIAIRTYERGVEDETLACGTGVTAAAISAHLNQLVDAKEIKVKAKGGDLKVSFDENQGHYFNIYLHGPAELVFKGEINV